MTTTDAGVTAQALREVAAEQSRAHGPSNPLVRLLVEYAELGVMPDGVEVLAAVRWPQRHRRVP